MGDINADAAGAADLTAIITACEEAYAKASRQGYADNPAIIAGVAALKKAQAALLTAVAAVNAGATLRADRALREARTAYINLCAAITNLGEENLRRMGLSSDFISDLKTFAQTSSVQ
jgi:hypothetical protein